MQNRTNILLTIEKIVTLIKSRIKIFGTLIIIIIIGVVVIFPNKSA